ncbi:MAG: hypothetical protein R3F59_35680 [Myxococcota bacterium]
MSLDHRGHLRLAWEAVGRGGLAGALVDVPPVLREMAREAGAPERYDHVLTVAYLEAVAARWRPGEPFDAFLARSPELFERP